MRVAERPDSADPFRDLRALIETLPVPSAPATYTQREAALGLALMDLSLRLEHVPRVAEHLTLIDRGHMTRSVSVDVDLQAIAGAQRRRITTGSSLWIPVSRYSRSDLAPVVVKDSTGAVVPRFTHRDSNRVTAAAFVRLLSMLIDAHPDVTARDTVVHKLRHTHQRSRWLLEAAIAELVTAGSLPETGIRTPLDYALLPALSGAPGREVDARAVRDLALAGLDELWPADARLPFAHLLRLACSQYMLVVLLDAAHPRRFLTWDAPLLPGRRPRAPIQRLVQSLLPVNREFVVEYETAIPRSVGAYHLTVEVNEEVSVRRFVLSSDVDDDFVQTLRQDVEMLASASAGAGVGVGEQPHRKLLELELQGIASRLAEVGRRRLTDLTNYRRYMAERHRSLGVAAPALLGADEVVAALGRGDCSVPVLAAFAAHYSADSMRHLARGPLAGEALPALAAGIRDYQLGHDITTDNDPRENGAHAHWRHPPLDLSPHSTAPVRAVAYLSLADEAPALIEGITRMVVGLALVVLGIGTLLTGGPQWLYSGRIVPDSVPAQADAVVAVLLLVPGLLIARLDLPSTHSVLGQLRQFQRTIAFLSVAVTTGLAIAAGTVHTDHAITRALQAGVAVLGFILVCCLLEFLARRARRRNPVPWSDRLPHWLTATAPRPRRAYAPDAVFDARGEV
ncbi:hypothetical protein Ais01nite_75880 [Asanoa ishikariensis]|uniref:Uncharacterized protein n=1 Tax=Asanoa ishikariensis TaxID=137265 RepID=A0A1H3L1I4_9ACTN|nr:hypothetical protein [Asanoa ishikariensis]GIF69553.1 hypothetical protein Ais01nite_75880 [Asanoa ishikariensis]SDY58367.1 hypothetical protein SAMN05421684_0481 [Asanoa ishikariensis]